MLFFVGAGERDGTTRTITSLTFGGVALTFHSRYVVANTFRNFTEFWYLLDSLIPAGSNSFVVTWSGSMGPNSQTYASCVFDDVHQTTPITDTDFVAGRLTTSEGITLNIATAGSFTMAAANASNVGDTSLWTGGTEQFEWTPGDFTGGVADNPEPTSGTNNLTVTMSSSSNRLLVAGATVEPTGGGPPPVVGGGENTLIDVPGLGLM